MLGLLSIFFQLQIPPSTYFEVRIPDIEDGQLQSCKFTVRNFSSLDEACQWYDDELDARSSTSGQTSENDYAGYAEIFAFLQEHSTITEITFTV